MDFASKVRFSLCLCVATFLISRVYAQDSLWQHQRLIGASLHYDILAMGQHMPFTFRILQIGSPTVLQWTDPQGNSGWLSMDSVALQAGTYSFAQQPYPNDTTSTAAAQTVLCISRQAFEQFKQQGKTTYDGITYQRKEDSVFTVSSFHISVLHGVSSETGAEIWILDDPLFPLLVASSNNPSGVDATWVGIDP
ncbi:hypothetical protein BXY57_0935 [Thermoflavifilum aggregans]|uniref:Uncharacterized protein n=1 Tax=Thermoflavifilum aggregans TaxID=454188 RepID=A0A2M9CU08_9BACT|nr:hypothetical protein [Thermoflavifilum aggregans]PJJ75361.1 hypothetical protein BXY57_0935 [Thermoflavifilum aggregans]